MNEILAEMRAKGLVLDELIVDGEIHLCQPKSYYIGCSVFLKSDGRSHDLVLCGKEGSEETCFFESRLDPSEVNTLTESAIFDTMRELEKKAPKAPAIVEETVSSPLELSRNAAGVPVCNAANVFRVLKSEGEFTDKLWFDEFHQRIMTSFGSKKVRQWIDIDTLQLMHRLQREFDLHRIGMETVHHAVSLFANQNPKNEPKDWMKSLVWDEVPRIDFFFPDAYGSEQTAYTTAVSKNFWISMVARVFSPGCQSDHMVILEGAQGIFKSSSLKIIADPWYTEAAQTVGSDDFLMVLQGNLIVEIGELASFSKAETNIVKQMITRRVDERRPKYGRLPEKFPRQGVLVGTTNDSDYLKDTTGGRRFWPIQCTEINLSMIRSNREQYFAEAVVRYRAGENWHEVPVDEAAAEQAARLVSDPWEIALSSYASLKDQVSTEELLGMALEIEISRQTLSDKIRVTNILKKLGWLRLGQRRVTHSPGKRVVMWMNPCVRVNG